MFTKGCADEVLWSEAPDPPTARWCLRFDRALVAIFLRNGRNWLGHESVETTQTYLHAQLALTEAALAKLEPYGGRSVDFSQTNNCWHS